MVLKCGLKQYWDRTKVVIKPAVVADEVKAIILSVVVVTPFSGLAAHSTCGLEVARKISVVIREKFFEGRDDATHVTGGGLIWLPPGGTRSA